MRRWLSFVWLMALQSAAIVWLASTGTATAQDVRALARQQAETIERTQAEAFRLQQERMESGARRAPAGDISSKPSADVSPVTGTCFVAKTIDLAGATLVAHERIKATLAPWQGRCLDLKEINRILEALTAVYVEAGYVAARAYVPEQDMSKGTLHLTMVEGSLDDIVLKGEGGTAGQLATAFPGLKGKPVNLRRIEQGVDQINRLGSAKASVALEPGPTLGGTVLAVTIDRTKPWSVTVGADNLGSPSTGIYQSRVDVGLDNVLGINDVWQFGYQRSMAQSPLFFSHQKPHSDTLTASFSAPYGRLTAGVDGSWSQYHSTIDGQLAPIDTSGQSASVAPYLSWLVDRDQTSKTWLTGRLTWKSTDNYLMGSHVDASSRMLSVATVELGHSRQFLGGMLSSSLAYHKGLPLFGAFDDASAPPGSPKGQFGKLTGSLAYNASADLGPGTVTFSSRLSGQWSDDPLFASEQMAIGGAGSVRGPRDALLSAGKAFYVRNELSYLLPEPSSGDLAKVVGRVEPYLGLDVGRTFASEAEGSETGTLLGAAVGLRNRGGRLNFDVSYSAILSTTVPERGRWPDGLVQARVSVSF